jgi:methionine-rich copper-binding protein CopC
LFGALTGIDVPTLRDVWATAPYLHDGSAATLESAIQGHTSLSVPVADLPKLAAYVREIGSDEVAAPAPGSAYTIWPASATPATASVTDSGAVNLGVKFTAEQSGLVTAIRFYKGAANTGTHVGTLWNSSGQSLASVTFTNETASGWQQAELATPVAIAANTTYVVSYHAPNGGYPVSYDYFAATGVDSPPLHALRDGVNGGNGVYVYGPTTQFPTSTYRTTNYWVDVVFTTGVVTDTTPPTVTTVSPADGASNVSRTANVSATFSEAVDGATITSATFGLRDAANADVPAAVSYDSATRVATLTPTSALAGSMIYTATVLGGGSGVKDTAGNVLAASRTWSFTTVATDTTPPTVTARSPAPGATGVSASANVTATFSEAMDAASIGTATFELRDAGNTLMAAVVTYNATSRVATLNPDVTLTTGATYTATLRGGTGEPQAQDAAGNPLAANVVWSFTIAADTSVPTVTATSPASSATGVSRTANITATFNEAMDPGTINTATFELRGPGNVLVPAVVSWSSTNRRATLNPNSTLASLTTYTVTVKGGLTDPRVKDLAGNALAADRVWTFRTR